MDFIIEEAKKAAEEKMEFLKRELDNLGDVEEIKNEKIESLKEECARIREEKIKMEETYKKLELFINIVW